MQARTSITAWLWALVLLPTVPLIGVLAYSTSQYAAERQRTVEAKLADEADDLVSSANARLEEVLGALTALAAAYETPEQEIPRLYSAAQRLQRASPTLAAVSMVDSQEKVIFLTAAPLGAPVATGELASLRETFSAGKPTLSSPFRSTINDRVLVALNVPILRDGRVVYSLRGVFFVEKMAELIAPRSLGPDRLAGIFDREGITIARSRAPEIYVGKPASPPLVSAIRNKDGSVWQGRTREGIDTLTVVRPIGAWQWSIGVSVPLQTIAEPVRAEMVRFGVFAILFVALLATTVVLLNRRITSRLLSVVDDAKRALTGHLDPAASTGIRELDDLRDSLTKADIYRSAILQEVQQRTAELSLAQQQLAEFAHNLDENIERERMRLAREVHDQIGAIFTGVSMLVSGLPKDAMSAEQRKAINEALDQGLATARRITAELRPPLLDHLGLESAVEDMASRMLGAASVAVRVSLSDANLLTPRQAIGAYRIIQEAALA
jgi:two-component system sensor histidine kinase/response regulator